MLTTQILAQVEPQRLLKATEGLVNGAFTITITRCEEDDVEGFVKNGDNIEYSVVLTPSRTFCSCKDSMYRHTTCKHSVALALHTIRNPQLEARKEEPAPNLKLGKSRPWPAAV